MAHPKRKVSKTRRDKRRTHHKAHAPQVSICQKSGEAHLRHRAYLDPEGNLLYNGRIAIAVETTATTNE